ASLLAPLLLSLWVGTGSLSGLTLLSSNQSVFVNVDHAPMGACSTMAYGYHGQPCGVGSSSCAFQWSGGAHYPRGITALWWLNATNNPANPVATSAPVAPAISSVQAGDSKVLLLWQGVSFATAYNIGRAAVSGGPYVIITNGLPGASFVDSAVNNGTTYYHILSATNSLGQSPFSPEVQATPIPSASPIISASRTSSGVSISWPPSYTGWVLQTNAVGSANPSGWGDLPESVTRSQMTFTAGPSHTEFVRLRHP
ncbi:MAG: hypothetical protein ACREIC_27925, partial [Limisphaerales bacterium]